MVEHKAKPGDLDIVFAALADPTRRALLQRLAAQPQTVGELAQPHQMTLAGVSKHIHVLQTAGLVRRERRGSFQVVHLKAEPLRQAKAWLEGYERFWIERLDGLQRLLEKEIP
ncbi:MAG: ArsR/SmtB family transcription factor [Chloroflexota bacterium]